MIDPAEREAEAQAFVETIIEGLVPGLIGNPFIPEWPTARQFLFLGLHPRATVADADEEERDEDDDGGGCVFESLYGGAAGGGKSSALLMGQACFAHLYPEFAGIMFRRTRVDLAQPGALLDRATTWWKAKGVHWNGTDSIFTFPNGAKVSMAYLKNPTDHLNYQGAEFQRTSWDELTQFPDAKPYKYVGLSRVRRKAGSPIPLRTDAASNPGGPGASWVKERFIGGTDPGTGERLDPLCPYVRATIDDNPHLDRRAYIRGLMMLDPTTRDQLLRGDWEAREPGDYFRREWFGDLLDPTPMEQGGDLWPSRDCVRVRWWDLAASEKEDAAYTAGVRMARHKSGVYAVEHSVAFRQTPGKRDATIIQTAQADGHGVTVGLEIEGGSGGIAQFDALERRLKTKGFRVVGARPRVELSDTDGRYLLRNSLNLAGKAGRASPVASCLQHGYMRRAEGWDEDAPDYGVDADKPAHLQGDGIRLFGGPWVSRYLDVMERFPTEGATCDEVDATSGAWAWLRVHGFGRRLAPKMPRKVETPDHDNEGDLHNVHPDDRPSPAGVFREARRRRWNP